MRGIELGRTLLDGIGPASRQDQHRHDEGPEVDVHALAKWMTGVGSPFPRRTQMSRRSWFTQSAVEWAASVSIALEPDMA
jgi:hypothetical protein